MSAYGKITRSNRDNGLLLGTTLWLARTSTPQQSHGGSDSSSTPIAQRSSSYVSIHHLTLESALGFVGLVEFLHETFAQVVEEGFTYPQEGNLARDAFESYFFAGDVFLAIIGNEPQIVLGGGLSSDVTDGKAHEVGLAAVQNDRQWVDCVAGFYYVKPNYPGRSSHICNAGFVVPPHYRGRNFGSALARSYVHYAPKLGYKASVFNLVYVNNTASVRLWERLGFTKAGLIPRAGRLRRPDGNGEHYVDAHVFYKSFVEDSEY